MSGREVTPIINRGVKSYWLDSLPTEDSLLQVSPTGQVSAADASVIGSVLGYTPADDANVVHKTGDVAEVVTGTKSFYGSTNGDFDGIVVGPLNQSQTVKIGYAGIESSFSVVFKSNIGSGELFQFKNNGGSLLASINQTGRFSLGGQVKLYGQTGSTLGIYQNDEVTLGNLSVGAITASGDLSAANITSANNAYIANVCQAAQFLNLSNKGVSIVSDTTVNLQVASGFPIISGSYNGDTVISPGRNTTDYLGDVVIQQGGSERVRVNETSTTFAGAITASGPINFATNQHNRSDDGYSRFLFSPTGPTYYATGGGSHIFRDGGVGAGTIEAGAITASGDLLLNSTSPGYPIVKMKLDGIDRFSAYTYGTSFSIYDYVTGGVAFECNKTSATFAGAITASGNLTVGTTLNGFRTEENSGHIAAILSNNTYARSVEVGFVDALYNNSWRVGRNTFNDTNFYIQPGYAGSGNISGTNGVTISNTGAITASGTVKGSALVVGAGDLGVPLDIQGTSSTPYSAIGLGLNAATGIIYNLDSTVGSYAQLELINRGFNVGSVRLIAESRGVSDSDLVVVTNSVERLRITNSGLATFSGAITASGRQTLMESKSGYSPTVSIYGQQHIVTGSGANFYAGTSYTNAAAAVEKFFGVVTPSTNFADFVWQGYDRAGGVWKEYARLTDAGNLTLNGAITASGTLNVPAIRGQGNLQIRDDTYLDMNILGTTIVGIGNTGATVTGTFGVSGAITASGQVSIGTTDGTTGMAGTSGLNIYHVGSPGFGIRNSSRAYVQYMSGSRLTWYDSTATLDRLSLHSDGAFTIGTTVNDGVSKLQVAGAITASGTVSSTSYQLSGSTAMIASGVNVLLGSGGYTGLQVPFKVGFGGVSSGDAALRVTGQTLRFGSFDGASRFDFEASAISASSTITAQDNIQQGYASLTPSYRSVMTAAGARKSEVGDGAGAWQTGLIETYNAALQLGNSTYGVYVPGNLGINQLSPTAWLHIGAGTLSNPPIKLTTGTLTTTPETGAVEFDGKTLFVTPVADIRSINLADGIIISDTVVANTTVETTAVTEPVSANELHTRQLTKFRALGIFSTANASDTFTARLKIGGVTIDTVVSTGKNVSNGGFDVEFIFTTRSEGVAAEIQAHVKAVFDNDSFTQANTSTVAVNTTAVDDITLTIQWSAANAGNTVTIKQAWCEFIG